LDAVNADEGGTLIGVLATKLLRVTSPTAQDAGAVYPVKEAGVQNEAKTSKDCHERVLGVGHGLAAIRAPRGA